MKKNLITALLVLGSCTCIGTASASPIEQDDADQPFNPGKPELSAQAYEEIVQKESELTKSRGSSVSNPTKMSSRGVAIGDYVLSPAPLTPNEIQSIEAPSPALNRVVGEVTWAPVENFRPCAAGPLNKPMNLVSDFGSGVKMLCGWPGDHGWEFWHVKERHLTELVAKSNLTTVQWTDLLYWATYWDIKAPDSKKSNPTSHKACRSHRLYLYNKVRKQLVAADTWRTIYTWNQPGGDSLPSGTIITTFPDRRGQCDAASVSPKDAD